MAGGTGGTRQAADSGGSAERSGPVAPLTRKVPGLRLAACPARRTDARGALFFLPGRLRRLIALIVGRMSAERIALLRLFPLA